MCTVVCCMSLMVSAFQVRAHCSYLDECVIHVSVFPDVVTVVMFCV